MKKRTCLVDIPEVGETGNVTKIPYNNDFSLDNCLAMPLNVVRL
jgi:hypothetical protein